MRNRWISRDDEVVFLALIVNDIHGATSGIRSTWWWSKNSQMRKRTLCWQTMTSRVESALGIGTKKKKFQICICIVSTNQKTSQICLAIGLPTESIRLLIWASDYLETQIATKPAWELRRMRFLFFPFCFESNDSYTSLALRYWTFDFAHRRYRYDRSNVISFPSPLLFSWCNRSFATLVPSFFFLFGRENVRLEFQFSPIVEQSHRSVVAWHASHSP